MHDTLMYDNTYNKKIGNQLREADQRHIDHQEENNAMGDTSFASHLEGMALRDANVAGRSGGAEATVRDMGFAEDQTKGAKGTGATEKRKRKSRKGKEEGGVILGLAEMETEPRGDPSATAPLAQDAPSSSKENRQGEATAQEEMPAARPVGGGRKMNTYQALVKEIMEKHRMKLPEAAKYIKENKLYSKDTN